jgi:glutathione S-transferase
MTTGLKLYHSPASPNARRVRFYLAEKGIDIPLITVDLGQKEQFSDAYRAINPRSQVPTLVLEDGTAIGEVPAIWRYLEETFPQTPLLGRTPNEKALVTMWERRMELDGFSAVMEAVRNAVPGLKGRALSGPHAYEQITELADRSKRRVANFYTDLDARLADHQFVAGDNFSVADITALATIDFATKALNMPIPDSAGHLKAWYSNISTRPAAKA